MDQEFVREKSLGVVNEEVEDYEEGEQEMVEIDDMEFEQEEKKEGFESQKVEEDESEPTIGVLSDKNANPF